MDDLVEPPPRENTNEAVIVKRLDDSEAVDVSQRNMLEHGPTRRKAGLDKEGGCSNLLYILYGYFDASELDVAAKV